MRYRETSRRLRAAATGFALLSVVLAGCGSSAAETTAQPTEVPYVPPTPLPTDTPVSEYSTYLTWRTGMVALVGGVKAAYTEMGRAIVQIDEGNGLNAEGDMQNAQDAIRNAQIQYQMLQPPSNYRHIHWVMGHALDTYLSGITVLLGGIDNGDSTDIRSGLAQLHQGDRDLMEIRALENQHQWLLWLDSNRGKPPQQQSGSA